MVKNIVQYIIVLLYKIIKDPKSVIIQQMFHILNNNKDIKFLYTIDDINNTSNKINSNKLINIEQLIQPLYLVYKSHNYWLFTQVFNERQYLLDITSYGFKHFDKKNIVDMVKFSIKKYDDLLKYLEKHQRIIQIVSKIMKPFLIYIYEKHKIIQMETQLEDYREYMDYSKKNHPMYPI